MCLCAANGYQEGLGSVRNTLPLHYKLGIYYCNISINTQITYPKLSSACVRSIDGECVALLVKNGLSLYTASV